MLFLSAKLVLNGRMFGKDDGFPDSAETPSRKDFRVMMCYDYCQGNLSSNASKVCKTSLRTIFHRDLLFTNGTRNFSSAERRLQTLAVLTVATEQNVAKVKCLIKEDPRITENEIKGSLFFIIYREA